MFERSTADARPEDEITHACIAGQECRGATTTDGQRSPKTTEKPDAVCEPCTHAVTVAVNDMVEIWLALHMAIGDQTRRKAQKVSGSRSAPINLNTDVDALKMSITEWLVAAAARVAETLNIDDPHPRNNTDTEHARIILACTRILTPHIDTLTHSGADDVMVWLSASETEYPGERFYIDTDGVPHVGVSIVRYTGLQIANQLVNLRRKARSLLALTTPQDKLSMPCPGCNQNELTRSHIVSINGKDIDQIDCGSCRLSWPYERYRQLCLIWVKEDEMERDKLQKQLDAERQKREICEWLLAKLEWQLGLGVNCPDVSAAEFARAILESEHDPAAEYLSDRDVAILVGVADSTIRSWAKRGHITRHIADDGSARYLATEVAAYARTNSHNKVRALN